MHGKHKEQYGSHSLNRWKERFALQHRHAGMSTGSEPYTLRGILGKGAQALMTRLGPSHDEGPWTQPHKIVNEVFSLYTLHTALYQYYDNGKICPIKRTSNVTSTICSIKESVPIDRAVVQYYIHQQRVLQSVQSKGRETYVLSRSIPINRAMAQCYLST